MAENILIYDITSLPESSENFDLEKILYLFKEHNIVLYDSTYGEKPEVVIVDINEMEVKFVDISLQENQKKLNGYKKMIK